MYNFLKAFLVLMKLLSLSQFYAPKLIVLFLLYARATIVVGEVV